MIEFKHVSKTFHGKKIIDDISFQIPDGEFVVLLGESGCGKTTTLKMINKLILPSDAEEANGIRNPADRPVPPYDNQGEHRDYREDEE